MSGSEFIAIDWGTTNRVVYLMRGDGVVVSCDRDDRGVMRLGPADFILEVEAIRGQLGDLPVIAAGMVGSSRGWREVPYCPVPADVSDLAGSTALVSDRVHIVPGVSKTDGGESDVMRGEEVQVIGAIRTSGPDVPSLFCQPGTHNKWIAAEAGSITNFSTSMTGEIFALLKQHSVLSGLLEAPIVAGDVFLRGVERGARCADLLTALFRVRAAILLGTLAEEDAASYASGLLIGSDVGSRDDLRDREVGLLATGDLAELYAQAIEWAGGSVITFDSKECFAAGIHKIWKEIR